MAVRRLMGSGTFAGLKHRCIRAAFFLVAFACTVPTFARAQIPEADQLLNAADTSTANAILATVGPITISVQEFLVNYEFGPAYVKKHPDAKRRMLDYLINEKLFALEASTPSQHQRIDGALREIEGDLATEELYRKDVLPHVVLPKGVIERGVRESGITLTVHWLYAMTDGLKDSLHAGLRRGTPFDTLFLRQTPDSLSRGNRMMIGTFFEIRRRNPEVAGVLDSLAPGQVSRPVKGKDGWYIFRIMDERRNMVTSESDLMKAHADVEKALCEDMADSISDAYVAQLMTEHAPVIVKDSFDDLLRFLAQFHLERKNAENWGFRSADGDPADSILQAAEARIAGQGNRALVTLATGRTIGLGAFMEWYRNRETVIKLPTSSAQAFASGAEQLVWRMVRDYLLTERARERKLNALPGVRMQKSWWEHKLLFQAGLNSLQAAIPVKDSVLQDYYASHRHDYRDSAGALQPFDRAHDDVLRDYYRFETARRVHSRVVVLRRKYPVEIRKEVLNGIKVPEGEKKAIDVYTVKKGGTLPRPAFPTVDVAWDSWWN